MVRRLTSDFLVLIILFLGACSSAGDGQDTAYPADDGVLETLKVDANKIRDNPNDEEPVNETNTNSSGTNEESLYTETAATEPTLTVAVSAEPLATEPAAVIPEVVYYGSNCKVLQHVSSQIGEPVIRNSDVETDFATIIIKKF